MMSDKSWLQCCCELYLFLWKNITASKTRYFGAQTETYESSLSCHSMLLIILARKYKKKSYFAAQKCPFYIIIITLFKEKAQLYKSYLP